MRRSWWVSAVGILTAVVLAASLAWSAPSEAAVLSSNVTVIMNGREVVVGIDPITVKAGLLVPAALAEEAGVQVTESNGFVTLTRETVTVRTMLGAKTATLGGESFPLSTAPILVSGHVFLPDEALSPLGVQVSSESGLLLIETWSHSKPSSMTSDEYAALAFRSLQQRFVAPTRDTTLQVEVTALTKELVSAEGFHKNPFVRGHLVDLMSGNLLVKIRLANLSTKIQTFPGTNYYLVDNLGNHYQASSEVISLQGDLFGNMAPAGVVSGVMVFPKPDSGAQTLTLYLQTSSAVENIATFHQ